MSLAALITNKLHFVYWHRPAPRNAITAGNIEYTPGEAGLIQVNEAADLLTNITCLGDVIAALLGVRLLR